MRLYHYSEDPNIERFTPRPPKNHPDAEPMVWAIDEWHSPLYYFPTDCPRVCFWPLPTTSAADLANFWPDRDLRMVIAVESKWLEPIQNTQIYRYTFDGDGFIDCEDHGVWVSGIETVPTNVEPLENLPIELAKANVELRLCPSLVPLGKFIQTTSFHWSLIRMRFAAGWQSQGGTPTMPPSTSDFLVGSKTCSTTNKEGPL